MQFCFLLLKALALLGVASAVKVGDKIPAEASLHQGFPPTHINLAERMAGKKVLLVGLPGAFTPT